jgi:hypothetical protein
VNQKSGYPPSRLLFFARIEQPLGNQRPEKSIKSAETYAQNLWDYLAAVVLQEIKVFLAHFSIVD